VSEKARLPPPPAKISRVAPPQAQQQANQQAKQDSLLDEIRFGKKLTQSFTAAKKKSTKQLEPELMQSLMSCLSRRRIATTEIDNTIDVGDSSDDWEDSPRGQKITREEEESEPMSRGIMSFGAKNTRDIEPRAPMPKGARMPAQEFGTESFVMKEEMKKKKQLYREDKSEKKMEIKEKKEEKSEEKDSNLRQKLWGGKSAGLSSAKRLSVSNSTQSKVLELESDLRSAMAEKSELLDAVSSRFKLLPRKPSTMSAMAEKSELLDAVSSRFVDAPRKLSTTSHRANRAVLVKDTMNQILTIFVDKEATVADLKKRIEEEIMVPPEHCHLDFKGVSLSNNYATLKSYGLKKDSHVTMFLIIKPNPSWAKWHSKLASNWNEFELKHFCEGEFFMQQWKEAHKLIKLNAFGNTLENINAEQRRHAYNSSNHKAATNASIKLLPKPALNPLTPSGNEIYKKYIATRNNQNANKASYFYFDVADALFTNGQQEEGLRVLTSLAELDLKNPQFLRLIAFKLFELGDKFHYLTIQILKQVKTIRPEEPQSFLLLAYAFVESANKLMVDRSNEIDVSNAAVLRETAQQHYLEAIQLINHIVMGKWDVRFAQIEVTAVMELTRVANFVREHGFDTTHHTLHSIDHRLLSAISVELRVVVVWDTDMTDVELHVEEPSGEKCYSFHNKTSSGGMLSRDFSHGYGPEEYIIRTASAGTYNISVKLFSAMSKSTGTTISVRVWTHFGNPKKERLKYYSVRLQKDREVHNVAQVTFSQSTTNNEV